MGKDLKYRRRNWQSDVLQAARFGARALQPTARGRAEPQPATLSATLIATRHHWLGESEFMGQQT